MARRLRAPAAYSSATVGTTTPRGGLCREPTRLFRAAVKLLLDQGMLEGRPGQVPRCAVPAVREIEPCLRELEKAALVGT